MDCISPVPAGAATERCVTYINDGVRALELQFKTEETSNGTRYYAVILFRGLEVENFDWAFSQGNAKYEMFLYKKDSLLFSDRDNRLVSADLARTFGKKFPHMSVVWRSHCNRIK